MSEDNNPIWCVSFYCPEWHEYILQQCRDEAHAHRYAAERCGAFIEHEIKSYSAAQVKAIKAFYLATGRMQKAGT